MKLPKLTQKDIDELFDQVDTYQVIFDDEWEALTMYDDESLSYRIKRLQKCRDAAWVLADSAILIAEGLKANKDYKRSCEKYSNLPNTTL